MVVLNVLFSPFENYEITQEDIINFSGIITKHWDDKNLLMCLFKLLPFPEMIFSRSGVGQRGTALHTYVNEQMNR